MRCRLAIRNENTDIQTAFEVLVRELEKRSSSIDVPSATSLMYCIVKAFDLISDNKPQLQQKVANAITGTLSRHSFTDIPLGLGLPDLMKVLRHSTRSSNRQEVINHLIDVVDFKDNADRTSFVLDQLLQNHSLLTRNNRERLREQTEANQDDSSIEHLRHFARECKKIDADLTRDVVSQSIYLQNLDKIKRNASAQKALDFLKEMCSFIQEETAAEYADWLIEKFSRGPTDQLDSNQLFAVNSVNDLPSDFIPVSRRKSLVEGLANRYKYIQSLQPAHAMRLTKAYLHLLPGLQLQDQKAYHLHLISEIRRGDPSFILSLVRTLKPVALNIYALDELLEEIKLRVQEKFNDQELRSVYFELAHAADMTVYIKMVVTDLWNQQHVVNDALEQAKPFLRAEEFRETIRELLKRYDNLPPQQVETALSNLASHQDRYTKKFLKVLIEELMNDWFKKPSIQARRGAKKLWRGIRDKAIDHSRVLYSRLLSYSEQAINDNSIAEDQNKIYFETLIEDYGFLSASHKKQLVDLCLRLTEEANPPVIRHYGYQLLRDLVHDEFAQRRVPEEMLLDLEHAQTVETCKAILNTLAIYKDYVSESARYELKEIYDKRGHESAFKEYANRFADLLESPDVN